MKTKPIRINLTVEKVNGVFQLKLFAARLSMVLAEYTDKAEALENLKLADFNKVVID